ncbi:MAG: S8 family serine peptidase [Candidatus Lokiarchaeota archaeon]|nr:S8 family serine peptidase [Candidatus Lokiarchaeota archaeon]
MRPRSITRRLSPIAWTLACLLLVPLPASTGATREEVLPSGSSLIAPSVLWAGTMDPERLLGINETFWSAGINGSGQNIAIIDTGIRASHEAFAGKAINWTDVTSEASPVPIDLDGIEAGHGTMCASIVAGNSSTYKGIAPGADITVVKMFHVDGGSITADNVDALAAVNRVLALSPALQIKVASLSWGDDNASDGNDALSQITENLVDGGLVTVVAAGNVVYSGKPAHVAAPGASEKVITVGSLDQLQFNVASFSLPGPTADNRVKPDIIAPGVSILGASHVSDTSYKVAQGTSFSTPIVSGIATLLVERYPTMDHYLLKHLFCVTALECIYTRGAPDAREGWGIVNPAGVVAAIGNEWSMDAPLAASILMNRSSARSFFTRVHLIAGVTHRFAFSSSAGESGMLDGRAEAYLYHATPAADGVPGLVARSNAGIMLFSPDTTGEYILAIKPLPRAWSDGGGNLAMPFTITHATDFTIQASWAIGIAGTVAVAMLVIAMARELQGIMQWTWKGFKKRRKV